MNVDEEHDEVCHEPVGFVSFDLEGAEEFANAKFQKLSDVCRCIGPIASKNGDGTHATLYKHIAFESYRGTLSPRRR